MKEFLTSMIGSIFKILPLYDENNVGLQSHIDSVAIQLIGAMDTFQELRTNQKYISVINLNHLILSPSTCNYLSVLGIFIKMHIFIILSNIHSY